MLRADRVAEEIKKVVAEIIQNEVEDPRLPSFTTVTDVEVSRDLAYATVYVSSLGQDENHGELTIQILDRAKKFIRYRLGQEVQLRNVPQVRFRYDNSIAEGNRMSKLIDQVIKEDEAKHGSTGE